MFSPSQHGLRRKCSITEVVLFNANSGYTTGDGVWNADGTKGRDMFIRRQTNGNWTYLMLTENERVDGRQVQRVLHCFGRLDELQASGQIDGLLCSLGRFGDKL
jgi:hypothetical protein